MKNLVNVCINVFNLFQDVVTRCYLLPCIVVKYFSKIIQILIFCIEYKVVMFKTFNLKIQLKTPQHVQNNFKEQTLKFKKKLGTW